MLHRCVQLGVFAAECRVRWVVDRLVWVDTVALDEPLALGTKHADLRGGRDALVHEKVVAEEPHLKSGWVARAAQRAGSS